MDLYVFGGARARRGIAVYHSMEVLPGVAVLAWYGPLIEGAVVKLALNRQRGTLFIWYNPRSRHFKPAGLFLARRLGAGAKPEWLWV